MRSFSLPRLRQTLYFENSVCVACGAAVGYSRTERDMLLLGDDVHGPCVEPRPQRLHLDPRRRGRAVLRLLADPDPAGRRRPRGAAAVLPRRAGQAPPGLRARRARAPAGSRATRRPGNGLTFDLLSSVEENVVIGHADGVITIDLAEGDTVHREKVQGEPRRALPHPARPLPPRDRPLLLAGLVDDARRQRARAGSCSATRRRTTRARSTATTPRARRPAGSSRYVSTYATMHPFEDFAETFAHFLHISDAIETAHAFGLTVDPDVAVAASPTSWSASGCRWPSRST